MANMASPKGRVAFPRLFKAKPNKSGDGARYKVTMAFSKDADLSDMRKVAERVSKESFGAKAKGARSPFKSGQEYVDKGYEGFAADDIVVDFWRDSGKSAPVLVGPDGRSVVDDMSEIYSGCFGRVSCDCYAYDKGGNRGINFGLAAFQKLEDGERSFASVEENPLAAFGVPDDQVPANAESMFS